MRLGICYICDANYSASCVVFHENGVAQVEMIGSPYLMIGNLVCPAGRRKVVPTHLGNRTSERSSPRTKTTSIDACPFLRPVPVTRLIAPPTVNSGTPSERTGAGRRVVFDATWPTVAGPAQAATRQQRFGHARAPKRKELGRPVNTRLQNHCLL